MVGNRLIGELAIFKEATHALAETTDLKEVKDIRDRAEACRTYAQSAALGLKIQNAAAELRLRAERRAGELLARLALRGGDRRSNARNHGLTLSDLSIDHNQSARWQREASVPDQVFEMYLAAVNTSGKEVTAQGLLRLERAMARDEAEPVPHQPEAINGTLARNGSAPSSESGRCRGDDETSVHGPIETPYCVNGTISELLQDIDNHQQLLAKILKALQKDRPVTLKLCEQRMVVRLFSELGQFVARLRETLVPRSEKAK